MKAKLAIGVLIIVFGYSCNYPTLPDEELTMVRTPYTGNEIRLDGCFVSDPHENRTHCSYLFFYNNGVQFSISDKLSLENIHQFTGGVDNYRDYKGSWGLYQIKDTKIEIQCWGHNVVAYQFILFEKTLNIINDTTLSEHVTNTNYIRYYHFKPFNPKPDSTNVFIK